MTYRELRREIKRASIDQAESGVIHYIAYWGEHTEGLVSNFINTAGITDNQLIKAAEEGLLIKDWDTFEVV